MSLHFSRHRPLLMDTVHGMIAAMDKTQRLAIKTAIETFTIRATQSGQMARDTLVKEGIYLKSGKLAPEYQPKPARKTA